ncbi:MAG: M55 family metallopeptidase [Candidatus Brocadiaceae bacterium]|nr:M55 family metallopeptidase [Candidatus Brocadiaceae bacterium]
MKVYITTYVDRATHEGPILDESFSASFAVGCHAMAGTINGFLDHTQSSLTIFHWYLNGRRIGEIEQTALSSAACGVPQVMVSGDEAACAEARAFFNPVETAAVKQGVGRNRAIAYPPDEARARIRDAARRSLALVGTARPFAPILPMEIKVEFTRSDYCDQYMDRAGVERLDARTLRWVTTDLGDWHPHRRPPRGARPRL